MPATLADLKLIVKAWNGKATRKPGGTARVPAHEVAVDMRSESLQDWARSPPTQPNDELYEAAEGVVESTASMPAIAWSGSQSKEPVATIPRTVGQVKHAYRSRARAKEAEINHKAMINVRASQGSLKQRHVAVRGDQLAVNVGPMLKEIEQFEEQAAASDQRSEDTDGNNRQLVIDSERILSDESYRQELLRVIRNKLSSGDNLLLRARLPIGVDTSEIKIALQQLCSQSLLFCVRDQSLLPSVDAGAGYVTMELLTRCPREMAISSYNT